MSQKIKRVDIGEKIYKFRYLIAVILFVVCVCFEINGSSIGMWAEQLGTSMEENGDVLGNARLIRSDEWCVNTPFAFSQYSSDFSYFSPTVRGDETDMFIVYGQPVRDFRVIFRPFHWGYLFLSPAKGLSFFWCGRFIALFMISLELGMKCFRKKKGVALAYGVSMAAAPVVQWWFAINGLVEMLIFGQLALLLFIWYFNEQNYNKRLLYAVLLSIVATSYLLLFYPAWQIPFAYAFLFILLGLVFEKGIKNLFGKKDFLNLGVFVILLLIEVGSVFYKSRDTISATLNTVYPGSRVETGGGVFGILASFATNLWMPFREMPYMQNVNYCSFFSMLPLGIILAIVLLWKNKKKDPMLISVLAGVGFLGAYCVVQWPEWLAKITLMSMSPSFRTTVAFSFLNLFLLFYVISRMEKIKIIPFVIFSGVFSLSVLFVQNLVLVEYWTKSMTAVTVLIVFAVCMAILFSVNRQRFSILLSACVVLVLVSGMSVNPIRKGADVIYEDPLYHAIERVEKTDSGLWVVNNLLWTMGNFPIMAGAPTINSTNVYPDMERWELLDPEGKDEYIYNRYAHIMVNIVKSDYEGPTFELVNPDIFRVYLTPELLEELEVKYVLSGEKLEQYDSETVQFHLQEQVRETYIYEIEY